MTIFYQTMVVASAIIMWGAVGYLFGFSLTAHGGVVSGFRPRTNNRLLLAICRPTASLSLPGKIVFALAMLAWVPIFF